MNNRRGSVPNRILQELPSKTCKQYFLWDEILKREVGLYPWLLMPLIEEIFNKRYPTGTKIEFLSTEYVVSREEGKDGHILHSVFSDLVIRAGERDIYHFECQMKRGRKMIIRMMEYDIHIAFDHGIEEHEGHKRADLHMFLPNSAILYLDHTRRTPHYEKCRIHFQDGGSYLFRVPMLRVQEYSPAVIEEKRLFILIPFLPIRFRRYIDKKNGCLSKDAGKELTRLLEECIMILNRQWENGMMTEGECRDLTEFLWKACKELFEMDSELIKEVQQIMEPVIRLMRDDLEDARKNHEESICNTVMQLRKDGKTREETGRYLQIIFMLKEEEAERKLQLYWQE